MGVLIDQLKHLSAHPNQFQLHAQASLRLLQRRSRRGDVSKAVDDNYEAQPLDGSTGPLRGVLSEPHMRDARRRPLKENHSYPELGNRAAGPWPTEVHTLPDASGTATKQCDALRTGQKRLQLRCGSFQIPHPRKAESGGEDSFFMCPLGAGVADGVGEWEWRFRVNPRAFADELMAGAQECLERSASEAHKPAQDRAAAALAVSYSATKAFGSATALVAVLDVAAGELGIANLGDSGARHIRWLGQGLATIVARTVEQQHSFNCPFQLARLPTPEAFPRLRAEGKGALVAAVERSAGQLQDRPSNAALYTFPLHEGDLIVLGTDGVFDNLHDSEICALAQLATTAHTPEVVHSSGAPEHSHQERAGAVDPTDLAAAIARAAFCRAADGSAKTPFGKHAKEAGFHHVGGKMDDITVLVAWAVEAPLVAD